MTRKPQRKKRPTGVGKVKPSVRRTAKAKAKSIGAKAAKPSPRARAADSLGDFMAAAARTLDLPMAAQWKQGVKANLAVTVGFASNLGAFELPDEAEPAPVFRA